MNSTYALGVFLSIVLFGFSIFLLIKARRKEDNRIDKYFDESSDPIKENKGLSNKLSGTIEKINFSKKYKLKINKKLLQANAKLSFEEFIIIRILLVLIIDTIFMMLTSSYVLVFFSTLIMWFVPMFILRRRYKKRLKVFDQQLGDAIRILSNGLKAGYSYMQAINTLVKEMPDPISTEFNILLKEMSLGVEIKKALNNFKERIESDDLKLMITAMIIQQETGGNLAEILDNISYTIRERVKIQGEIKTLTAQGKISGVIISLMPVLIVLFLFAANREYINILITSTIGRMLIVLSIVSELIGIFFIRRIIQIDF